MKRITTINEAIKLLTERRGFKIKDLKQIDYLVFDEELNEYMTADELINYANDQSLEELY